MAEQPNTPASEPSEFDLMGQTLQGNELPEGVAFRPIMNSCGDWCNMLAPGDVAAVPPGESVIYLPTGELLTVGVDYIVPSEANTTYALPYSNQVAQWLDQQFPGARNAQR